MIPYKKDKGVIEMSHKVSNICRFVSVFTGRIFGQYSVTAFRSFDTTVECTYRKLNTS